MLRRLYQWTLSLAESRRATWALGAVSFAESSVFPVPPDVMLVPMSLAKPKKAWFYAMVCTLTSVAGGLLGYAIGALFYDTLGQWLINLYGLTDKAAGFREMYAAHGHWVILIKGVTPIPYKLVTIVSGLAAYDIWMFILLSLITRGIRFFALAAILNRFGDPIRAFLDKNLTLVLILMVATIVGGFLLVGVLF